MPKISVIVPVYKVESYLHRCVDSILAQTFTDFELILVDDGSPDNCGAICDEYKKEDDRIHVIHQENGGLSAARNAGINWAFANSNSEWISFIDSDDRVHPRFLEYLFCAAKKNNTGISACLFKRVTAEEPVLDEEFQTTALNWDVFYIRNWTNGVVAWNKLYKKELFEEYRYPVGKTHEDEFLTYRILEKAGSVAVVDLELYYYFQNAESIMNREFSLARLDSIDALFEQCTFAKEKGYTNFYYNRMKALIVRLATYLVQCNNSSSINPKEKAKVLREMRSKLRKILMVKGKEIAPLRENRWYYELAFPKVSWFYWTSVGIIGKIKNLVNKKCLK